ncbi:MAG: phage tail tape measure protein [Clostridiaceae bacterium]|nr:phage tail tape measure protein [Clostridiaceae bacterium]
MASNNKILSAIVDLAGNVDPSLGKAVKEATSYLESINLKAVAVGAAVGTIAVATGKAVLDAGKYLYNLGADFDDAVDTIRVGTGATGDALDALNDDFEAVYKSVPTTMEDASSAIADYNTRLGLTGDTLQGVSTQALQVSDMLGEDLSGVIEGSSQAFQQWNIDADDMGEAMDYVFKVSQSTGAGFTDLMDTVQQFGPQLQEMGYSFDEATAMIGQLDKAGVNADEVMAAMKKSVSSLAKEGISAKDGINQYFEAIQNAGSATEATTIATEIFGTRAASTMASAIRDGSLSVDEFTASMEANGETISGASTDTYDFAEYLQLMKQNLEVALQPMASTIFSQISDMMPTITDMLNEFIPIIMDAVSEALPFVQEFLGGIADLLPSILPMIASLASSLLPILVNLVGTLLPPLLDLIQTIIPPLIEILQAILPPIASLLTSILPIITQIVSAVLPVMVEIIAALIPVLTPVLNLLVEVLNNAILPLLDPVMSLVEALLPGIVSLLGLITPILSPILALLQPISDIIGVIVGAISKVIGWVSSGLGWIVKLFFGGSGDTSTAEAVASYATGGFTDGISIAGEDPSYPTEAVISFNPAYRSANLAYWAQAGQMLGAVSDDTNTDDLFGGSGSTSVVYDISGLSFSPQITVNGDADENELIRKLKELEPEFVDFVLAAIARREEGAYVTADSRIY